MRGTSRSISPAEERMTWVPPYARRPTMRLIAVGVQVAAGRRGPAGAAAVLLARRPDAFQVQALGLGEERGAGGDVPDDLLHDARLLLDHDEGAGVVDVVAVGDQARLRAAPVGAVLAVARPLVDGLPLELGEAGEHLEDEPAGRRRGVYGLGRALQGHACLLQAVVRVHHHEQRAPDPAEPADEHGVEEAARRVGEQLRPGRSLAQRHGAGDRLVLVDLHHFEAVERDELHQELVLRHYGLFRLLLLGGDALVDGQLGFAGVVHERCLPSLSFASEEGSTDSAAASRRMVRGWTTVSPSSIRPTVERSKPAILASSLLEKNARSRRARTRSPSIILFFVAPPISSLRTWHLRSCFSMYILQYPTICCRTMGEF